MGKRLQLSAKFTQERESAQKAVQALRTAALNRRVFLTKSKRYTFNALVHLHCNIEISHVELFLKSSLLQDPVEIWRDRIKIKIS